MRYPAQTKLANRRPFFEKRAALARSLRSFFDENNFLEVTTPSLIITPAQEEYIETIAAADGFLRPSPELEMKIMLAAGYEKIFQIGPCWRVDEHGRRHRREFTMVEYYAAGADYRWLQDFTTQMLARAAKETLNCTSFEYQGNIIDLSPEMAETITVSEAFLRYAGCPMEEALSNDLFDELMVTKIEPELGNGHLTYLTDYPASRAALARKKPNNSLVAERWELYIAGLELANAFSELTDETEQRMRFAEAAATRKINNLQCYPEANAFFEALHAGLPEAAGNALGFDRLTMIFSNTEDIADVQF